MLAQYPLPLAMDVDPYDVLGVARTEHVDNYAGRGERPPYISRTTADRELDEALKKATRFVILTGRAKSGKSRTAFEAVRRNFPDYAMLIPARPGDPSRLPELLQSYDHVASNPNTVLWLDDMERFVDAGSLTVSVLSRSQQKHQTLVIVATLRSIEFDKLTAAGGEIGRNAREMLSRAVRVHLGDFLAASERKMARRLYSHRYPNLDFSISVGEAFVAAQRLKARYDTGAESCPEGAAVVRAAIDCRRIGVVRPVPEIFLKELWKHYFHEIEPLRDVSDAAFGRGLSWAKHPLGPYVALLAKVGDPESGGGFSVPDYLVEHVDEQQRPIPLVVWDLAKDRYQDLGSDANGVGYSAWLRGLTDKAKDIWKKGLLLGDGRAASNLGALLKEDGDRNGAKAAFERGMALGAGLAAHNLGVLLAEDGDRSGAKAAYELGMALGEGSAAFNLGFLLVEDGDRGGAKAAYEQGIALGEGSAAFNLGLLLEEDGDRSGAKAAFEQGMALGDGPAARHLGLLHEEDGDRSDAKVVYKWGIGLGDAGAAVLLGLLLKGDGDRSGARAAFVRGMELGHGRAAGNLGLLLAEDGDRNGAKAAYEQGIALGEGKLTLLLGTLRAEDGDRSGAKAAFEQGMALGGGTAALKLGVLLAEDGDRGGAKAAFERGMALGSGAAALGLGVLLQEDGHRSGAKAAFERGMALGNGTAARGLGVLLEEEGDRSGAKAAFEQGMALGNGTAAFTLGVLLEEDGDRSAARAAYQAAVELGFQAAQEKLQHLDGLM